MVRHAPTVRLTEDECQILLQRVERNEDPSRETKRATIVLEAADGKSNAEIAEAVGMTQKTVGKWRRRWLEDGVAGLRDDPRPGRPPKFTAVEKGQILSTVAHSSKSIDEWSLRELQEALDDEFDISVGRLHQLRESVELNATGQDTPSTSIPTEVESKRVKLIGVYLDDHVNGFVISVNEDSGQQPAQSSRGSHTSKQIEDSPQTTARNNLFAPLLRGEYPTEESPDGPERWVDFESFLDDLERQLAGGNLQIVIGMPAEDCSTPDIEELHSRLELTVHSTSSYTEWVNHLEVWLNISLSTVPAGELFESRTEKVQAIVQILLDSIDHPLPLTWKWQAPV